MTDAVHEDGGRIIMQLWHVGRISHPDLQPDGNAPVAPSAIMPEVAKTYISADSGMVEIPSPRALTLEEMPGIVDAVPPGCQERQARHGATVSRNRRYVVTEIQVETNQ